MSQLIDFYRGHETDCEGRRLSEILAWDDEDLEEVHDFIQWLFPLPEPSAFNPEAPLLTPEDIAAFKTDPLLKNNLRKSFERILAFLGLALEDAHVVESSKFAARAPDVWAFPNHNWLRLTRILRSLRLLGLEREARALYERLHFLHGSRRFPIGDDTFAYWVNAVEG